MALFLFEIFLGFITKFLIEKKNKFIDNRISKLSHKVNLNFKIYLIFEFNLKINGILIYLLAKANIGIGIKLFKDSLLYIFLILNLF